MSTKIQEKITELRERLDELESTCEDHFGVIEFEDTVRKLTVAEDAIVQAQDAAESEIEIAEEN